MKTENKYNLMKWALVFLAVMNVSILATIAYHQYKSNKKDLNLSSNQNFLVKDSEKFSGRYFRDYLNLSSEQMEKFRSFNPVFRHQACAITIDLAEIRKKMQLEMSANKVDTSRLNALSDSIGYLHSKLKKLTYRYYFDLKGICNKEQEIKLEQLFKEMATNDAPMAFPGRGKHLGKN